MKKINGSGVALTVDPAAGVNLDDCVLSLREGDWAACLRVGLREDLPVWGSQLDYKTVKVTRRRPADIGPIRLELRAMTRADELALLAVPVVQAAQVSADFV